jgi:hypothetical protein
MCKNSAQGDEVVRASAELLENSARAILATAGRKRLHPINISRFKCLISAATPKTHTGAIPRRHFLSLLLRFFLNLLFFLLDLPAVSRFSAGVSRIRFEKRLLRGPKFNNMGGERAIFICSGDAGPIKYLNGPAPSLLMLLLEILSIDVLNITIFV